MSYEQLKAFVAKVKQDKTLQDQVKTENADLVYIAKAAGFSITTDDLRIAYTQWVRDSLASWNKKDISLRYYSKYLEQWLYIEVNHYFNLWIYFKIRNSFIYAATQDIYWTSWRVIWEIYVPSDFYIDYILPMSDNACAAKIQVYFANAK